MSSLSDNPVAKPAQKRKWPGIAHGNRRYGPDIILREDNYVIREDERPDHVIARDKAKWQAERSAQGAGQAASFGGGGGGFGGAGAGGKFEECWICGSTEHRRSDCPNKGFDGSSHSIQRKLVCLGCRQRGHILKDCPKAQGGALGQTAGVTCYNCGSTEHSYLQCSEEKIGNGWTHAQCFVCNGKGHLSRDCPKNAQHGLYPRGGGCKRCGSTQHLVKDCVTSSSSSGGAREEEGVAQGGDSDGEESAPAPKRAKSGSWFGVPAASDEADLGGNVAVDDEESKRKKAKASEGPGKAFYKSDLGKKKHRK